MTKIIQNNSEEVKAAIKESFEKSNVAFPVKAFPEEVSSIIQQTKDSLLFPVDFTGSSILVAASIALGTQYKIEVMPGYIQSASLYCALVGNPGVNKSAPLKFILSPIEEIHKELHKDYMIEKKEYNRLNEEEKKLQPEPKPRGLLLSDSTFESVIKYLENNPHGIGIYNDELASWTKNFNRYSNGSDNEYWLTIWSNNPLIKSRASDDPIYIDYPFASVIGTIQNNILSRQANKIGDNGFFDRFLYAYPRDLKKRSWLESNYTLSNTVESQWKKIINGLFTLRSNQFSSLEVKTNAIPFSQEGKELINWYQAMITHSSNQSESDKIKGVLAKLEMITIRLSLIQEAINCVIKKQPLREISLISVERAIRLSCYFKSTAVQLFLKETIHSTGLKGAEKRLYDSLPRTFKTSDASSKSEQLNVTKRTIARWLNNEEVYKKDKTGHYRKIE